MANLNLKGSTFLIRPAQSVPKNFAFQPGSTYPQSHDETGGGGGMSNRVVLSCLIILQIPNQGRLEIWILALKFGIGLILAIRINTMLNGYESWTIVVVTLLLHMTFMHIFY